MVNTALERPQPETMARGGCAEKSTREAGHAVTLPWCNLSVFSDLLWTCLLPQQHPYACSSLFGQWCFYYPRAGFGSCQSLLDPEGSSQHLCIIMHIPWLSLAGHIQVPPRAGLSLTPSLPWICFLQHPWGFSSLPHPVLGDLSPASSGEKQCCGNPPTLEKWFLRCGKFPGLLWH